MSALFFFGVSMALSFSAMRGRSAVPRGLVTPSMQAGGGATSPSDLWPVGCISVAGFSSGGVVFLGRRLLPPRRCVSCVLGYGFSPLCVDNVVYGRAGDPHPKLECGLSARVFVFFGFRLSFVEIFAV